MIRYTVLILGLLAAHLAGAADITLSVDNATPNVGDTLTITVGANIAAGESCVALNQYLTFDPARLQLTAQSAGGAGVFVPDSRGLAEMNATGEIHAGAYSLAGGVSGGVVLGVFTFRAASAGVTQVRTVAYTADTAPFGDVLYRSGGALVVPGMPGAITITIGGGVTVYTVAYDRNGAVSGTVPGSQSKTQGVAVVVAGNVGNLAKPGYNFDGWNTATDGVGGVYLPGSNYTADASATLYAQWSLPPLFYGVASSNGNLVLRWQSWRGKRYVLQSTTNLLAGFTEVVGHIQAVPPVNTHTIMAQEMGTAKTRFYRIREE